MAVLAGAVLALASVTVWFFLCHRKKERRDVEMGGRASPSESDGVGPTRFPYDELERATDNFNESRMLGKGGFGAVYHGVLRGTDVAIKKIVQEGDGEKSFRAEVMTIGQLNQKNLVRLLGWCRRGSHYFVVYEYMPNRSLDCHLFGGTGGGSPTGEEGQQGSNRPLLVWEKRYNIILALASALKYLHEDLRECVVHRDVKAANVMLDADFNARLGDFGLARLVEHGNSVVTSQNAGTVDYMAPEILHRRRHPSKESDVYSFGVVALEVACGMRACLQPEQEEEKLVAWVRRCHDSGDVLHAADRELQGRFDEREMKRLMVVGLMCTLQDRNKRPSIAQVIQYLHPEASIPVVPEDTLPIPSPCSDPSRRPQLVICVSNLPPLTTSLRHVGR